MGVILTTTETRVEVDMNGLPNKASKITFYKGDILDCKLMLDPSCVHVCRAFESDPIYMCPTVEFDAENTWIIPVDTVDGVTVTTMQQLYDIIKAVR